MITGKQRSYLRGLANKIDPIVYIGKQNLTDNIINEINTALETRELVKIKIQENSTLKAKDVANEVASKLGAEYVQAIGRKFTLYRQAEDPEKRQIELPKK